MKIIRKPFLLNKNNVALLYIFHRCDHLDDMWSWDIEDLEKEQHNLWDEAAFQLFEQMDGTYSRMFLESVIKEAQKRLDSF